MGVSVRDGVSNNFREFGDILQDVQNRWSSYSNVEKLAIAQSVGGRREMSATLYSNI